MRLGESIAQRSQRRIRAAWYGRLFVDSVGFGRVAHALGREHRTEVTEATEEDLKPLGTGGFLWTALVLGG